MTPPEALMADCPEPARPGATIEDALNYIPEIRGALQKCNTDKAKLREWVDGS